MSENKENQTTPEVADKSSQKDEIEVASPAKDVNNQDISKNIGEKVTQLENDMKQKDNLIATLKARITQLEKDLAEAAKFKAQHAKEAEEVAALKDRSEDTLTRAKDIIFEKTKIIKNQELQIEALNLQITSIKEVVTITKDLLEIRNLEVKQLEEKIQCMEGRFNAEKERYNLMHKKLEAMIRYNGELKREYETQLCLFSALRERYNERELAKGVLDDASVASTSASGDNTTPASTGANTSDIPSNTVASSDASGGNDTGASNNTIPACNSSTEANASATASNTDASSDPSVTQMNGEITPDEQQSKQTE